LKSHGKSTFQKWFGSLWGVPGGRGVPWEGSKKNIEINLSQITFSKITSDRFESTFKAPQKTLQYKFS